jgi:putative restriction endonuclease
MDKKEIIDRFESLAVWKSGDRRAPHKPLLILLALGCLPHGDRRLLPYTEVDPKLEELLTAFGTPRNAKNTHYPFWRLRNDDIWEVERADALVLNSSGGVRKTELRDKNISAGFTEEVFTLLKENPQLASKLGLRILASHFSDTIHEDIIHETGFNPKIQQVAKQQRDPQFRREVLRAYEHKCAVCNFDVRMGAKTLCIEAAHIKWHSHGGPDDISNGIALCTMHHKLFDLGAFTLDENRQFLVSERVVGSDGFDWWLSRFHGDEITRPVRGVYEPGVEYLAWNRREVFKMPGREV